MKKCFISSDVRVMPASCAEYTPTSVIRSMTTAWLHLAADVINNYNALVAELSPEIRCIAHLPIINGDVWISDFVTWIGTHTFRDLCTVCDNCRSAIQHGRPCTIQGVWLPQFGGIGPKFSAEFALERTHFNSYEVEADITRQFLCLVTFPRKTPVTAACQFEQAAEAWSTFEDQQDPVYDPALLESLQSILFDWLKDYRPEVYPCHHGPGTTSEQCNESLMKYNQMTLPLRTVEWCKQRNIPLDPMVAYRGCEYSRVMFVPKNWKQPRGISAEPIGLQWAQQGVKENLYSYIARHRYLRRHIVLPDQSVNRSKALEGSIDGSLSTIDLTAASDSVTLKIVKGTFPPYVLEDLLATRSEYSLLGNRIYRLRKFAPMGSAVCFPVESLLFAAICQLACDLNRRGVWYVYGDDIIISTSCARTVMRLLQRCGFTPNENKSFITGHYRESCGIEALYGFDITPIYYRIPCSILGTRITPEGYQSAVSLANQCYNRFPSLRSFIIARLTHMRVQMRKRSNGKAKSRPLIPGWTTDPLNGSMLYTPSCKDRQQRWRLGEYPSGGPQVTEVYCDIVTSKAPSSDLNSRDSQPVYDWLARRCWRERPDVVEATDLYSYQKLRKPAFKVGWVCMFGEEHYSST